MPSIGTFLACDHTVHIVPYRAAASPHRCAASISPHWQALIIAASLRGQCRCRRCCNGAGGNDIPAPIWLSQLAHALQRCRKPPQVPKVTQEQSPELPRHGFDAMWRIQLPTAAERPKAGRRKEPNFPCLLHGMQVSVSSAARWTLSSTVRRFCDPMQLGGGCCEKKKRLPQACSLFEWNWLSPTLRV